MPNPMFRLYLALSLDGLIADKDGGVHWLDGFDPEQLGFSSFLSQIGTIVMGRSSYDQALGFGLHYYGDRRIVVMTQRDFTPAAPNVESWNGSVEALADKLAAETASGDVWVFGGGKVARSFLEAGRLDTLELYVVPLILGEGISLFGPGTVPAKLQPMVAHRHDNGVVQLTYRIEQGAARNRAGKATR